MKMKRRQNLREQKQEVKKMIRAKRSRADLVDEQQADIIKVIQEDIASRQNKGEESKEIEVVAKPTPTTSEKPKSPTKVKVDEPFV